MAMSAEVIFPDDSRWGGSKRLAVRGLVRLPGSLVSGHTGKHTAAGGCKLPPGPDVLVLAADESGATYSEITLTFNGTAVMLFGTELGAPASFDLDPILIPTITRKPASTHPGLPSVSIPSSTVVTSSQIPVPTLAPVNCDFVLTSLGGLVDTIHTLRVSLKAQGQLYIYNATVAREVRQPLAPSIPTTSPATSQLSPTLSTLPTTTTFPPATRHHGRLAIYVAVPSSCIALIALGVIFAWLRWKNRRHAEIRVFAVPASTLEGETSRESEGKMSFFIDKSLPLSPANSAQGVSGARVPSGQDPTALVDLGRAVEQAGFSVLALVTSLRLVHRARAVEDTDAEQPPEYEQAPDRAESVN